MTIQQLFADQVRIMLIERNMTNNHENREICVRTILNDLVSDGLISSYTWIGDDIQIQTINRKN